MSIDSKDYNHRAKLSTQQRFGAGATSLGISTAALIPETAAGVAAWKLAANSKDIFVKSERKILPTVKNVILKNPRLALLFTAGAVLSVRLESLSQKLLNRAVTGKNTDKPDKPKEKPAKEPDKD